ncbi:hypothetical protein Taro_033616, partial [Colocasia esculenta]|nr:hypothetical protein [Colocasia esculenta]
MPPTHPCRLRPLLHFSFTLAVLSSGASLASLAVLSIPFQFLGVAPEDEKYFAADIIACRDGSKTFRRDRLNDGFCDCPDGTDEPGVPRRPGVTGPGLATAGEDSPPRRSLLLAPPALRVAIFMVGNRGNGWIEVRRRSRWVERRPDEYSRKVMPGKGVPSQQTKFSPPFGCCFRCLEKGHKASACRNVVKCFRCKGVGHRSLACRSEALQCLEACLPDQGIAPPEPVGVREKGLQRVVDVPWSPFVKKDWARLGACGVAEVRGAGPDKYSEKSLTIIWRQWSVECAAELVPAGKLLWCRLLGIPLHIWNVESFHAIVAPFGVLKKIDRETLNGCNLKFARMLVEVESLTNIPKDQLIRVRGQKFRVSFQVELGEVWMAESGWVAGSAPADPDPESGHSRPELGRVGLSRGSGLCKLVLWVGRCSPPRVGSPGADPTQSRPTPLRVGRLCHPWGEVESNRAPVQDWTWAEVVACFKAKQKKEGILHNQSSRVEAVRTGTSKEDVMVNDALGLSEVGVGVSSASGPSNLLPLRMQGGKPGPDKVVKRLGIGRGCGSMPQGKESRPISVKEGLVREDPGACSNPGREEKQLRVQRLDFGPMGAKGLSGKSVGSPITGGTLGKSSGSDSLDLSGLKRLEAGRKRQGCSLGQPIKRSPGELSFTIGEATGGGASSGQGEDGSATELGEDWFPPPVPFVGVVDSDSLSLVDIQDDSLAVGDVAGVRIYAEAPPVNSGDTVEAEAPRSPSCCGGGVGAATLCLAPTKDASWAFYDYDVRHEASSVDTAGSLDVENRAMVLWAGHGSEVFSQQGFEQVVPLPELDCATEQWSDDLIKQVGCLVGIMFEGKEEYVRKAFRKMRRDLNLQLSLKRKESGGGLKIGRRELLFRRNLVEDEISEFLFLSEALDNTKISPGMEDSRVWKWERSEKFLVKSVVRLLIQGGLKTATQLLKANLSLPLPSQPNLPKPSVASPMPLYSHTTRTIVAMVTLVVAFMAGAAPLLVQKPVYSFKFGFTNFDQTPEVVKAGIKIHLQGVPTPAVGGVAGLAGVVAGTLGGLLASKVGPLQSAQY